MARTAEPGAAERLVLDLARLAKPLDWEGIFGRRAARREMEIGIGSGYFLSRYAEAHPDTDLIGLDKMGSEVWRTADKCARMGLENVRVLRCDALYFLEDYPQAGDLDALHVYYSDPWPKKRHHKRRLWRPAFVPLIEKVVKPGGDLFLKTDVTAYYEVIQEVLGAAEHLELVAEQRLDHEPMEDDYVTNFQRKAVEQGHPLHWQHWRRG